MSYRRPPSETPAARPRRLRAGGKRKVKRIVLGEGHPWYSSALRGGLYDTVQLTNMPVSQAIIAREYACFVPLNYGDSGNWNRVRLVLEVIK